MEKLRDILKNADAVEKMQVYQDDICVALLSPQPASLCHIIITPRREVTILEQLEDNEVEHIFVVVNTISKAIFDSINIQGTNILIQNGVPAGQDDPQFSIHVFSRTENDGVQLDWKQVKASDDQLDTARVIYEQAIGGKVLGKQVQKEVVVEQAPTQEIHSDEGEENYLVKYFERRP